MLSKSRDTTKKCGRLFVESADMMAGNPMLINAKTASEN